MSAAVTNVAAWALPFDEFLEMLVDRARSDTLAKAFWDPKKHNGRGGLAYRPLPVVNLNLLLMIQGHLSGGPHLGIYLMQPGSDTTRLAAFDLDDHESTLPWSEMRDAARLIVDAAGKIGLNVLRSGQAAATEFTSSSGGMSHNLPL
jgi:hypothetical protein